MQKYETELYVSLSGRSPVKDFFLSLDPRTKRKFYYVRNLLEEKGPKLTFPYCKYLTDGIFELRFTGKEWAVRFNYFFVKNNLIIFTNGFVKKTNKTPITEIKLASQRKKIYLKGIQYD